jgi:hypothetical protein
MTSVYRDPGTSNGPVALTIPDASNQSATSAGSVKALYTCSGVAAIWRVMR